MRVHKECIIMQVNSYSKYLHTYSLGMPGYTQSLNIYAIFLHSYALGIDLHT
jgi:hypothetical protein